MERICILILAGLLLTACHPSPTAINIQETVEAAVTQTLKAQATQAAIQAEINQTLTAIPQTPSTPLGIPPSQPPASDTPVTTPVPTNIPTPPSPSTTPSTPQIKFTYVPPLGSTDDVQGTVEGVDPGKYVVTLYIKVAGGWWIKPTFASPTCNINTDGTWDCPYVAAPTDTSATVIRAYLIPIGYNPPAASGGASLPTALNTYAVAHVEATR